MTALAPLDVERWVSDMETQAHLERVRADFMSGVRSGVNGTPTFFINGVKLEGALPAVYFDQAIAYELAHAGSNFAPMRLQSSCWLNCTIRSCSDSCSAGLQQATCPKRSPRSNQVAVSTARGYGTGARCRQSCRERTCLSIFSSPRPSVATPSKLARYHRNYVKLPLN